MMSVAIRTVSLCAHYYSSKTFFSLPRFTASNNSRYFSRTYGLSRSANSSERLRSLINSCTSARTFNRSGAVIPEASFNSISFSRVGNFTPSISTVASDGFGKRFENRAGLIVRHHVTRKYQRPAFESHELHRRHREYLFQSKLRCLIASDRP